MPRVVHIVVTGKFAGVERYVTDTARETVAHGWEPVVIGGNRQRMLSALEDTVDWLPGATAVEALRSLRRLGRRDICHAHMTIAETVSITARPFHRAPIVSTRHFAAPRGASRAGRLLSPLISTGVAHEIAVSDFVARKLERPPDVVIRNGVPPSDCLWRRSSRVVLVLQRLSPEKDTMTALRAWQASHLADDGWSLRIVGNGVERERLENYIASADIPAVSINASVESVAEEFRGAGVLLAPAPAEPFGLAVLEAMAAGVPVVGCAAGGHLETIGLLPTAAMFSPTDADGAAAALLSLRSDEARAAVSDAGLALVESRFTIARHVDQLQKEYSAVRRRFEKPGLIARTTRDRRPSAAPRERTRAHHSVRPPLSLRELVVCSLEPWDEVWRRNQFFVDFLMKRNGALRVLFVEPPADVLFDLKNRRVPLAPRLRSLSDDGRLQALRPLKLLPRKLGGLTDRILGAQVLLAARAAGFSRPTLWINDVTYAPLISRTGWASIYDVTDDWLLAPFPPRELERLHGLDELALAQAGEVVVCSPGLASSRGASRAVTLVPNGVDLGHFRRPQPRPIDLPAGPTAVYVGSLHEARIDVDLVVELAATLPQVTFVFVGPSSFGTAVERLLGALPNVELLGQRAYRDVPAYLQHADVVIVPHRVSAFTESLDPIKAYECLAIDSPTVATPVAGFREHHDVLNVVPREEFPARVASVLQGTSSSVREVEPASWGERATAFEGVLQRLTSY